MGQLLSCYHYWLLLSSSSWVGWGFSSEQRQVTWGQWLEFLSYGEHPQHLTRCDKVKASHKFKVFILQYPLCFSPFDSFLHFKVKASRHGGWRLRPFLRENAPIVKHSRIRVPYFKFVEPCFYRITFRGFPLVSNTSATSCCILIPFSDSCFSLLFRIFCIWEENPGKNRYVFMHG